MSKKAVITTKYRQISYFICNFFWSWILVIDITKILLEFRRLGKGWYNTSDVLMLHLETIWVFQTSCIIANSPHSSWCLLPCLYLPWKFSCRFVWCHYIYYFMVLLFVAKWGYRFLRNCLWWEHDILQFQNSVPLSDYYPLKIPENRFTLLSCSV